MSSDPRDTNFVPAKLAVLNTDPVQGQHLVPIRINATTGGIKVDTASTVSFTLSAVDPKDENYVGCWLFEGTDGNTYPAVATSTGKLLISTV